MKTNTTRTCKCSYFLSIFFSVPLLKYNPGADLDNYRTQVSEKMRQYVALVNSIYEYRTQAEVNVVDRYPSSSLTIFDVHGLVSRLSWANG